MTASGSGRIQHAVIFALGHEPGSAKEQEFFRAVHVLKGIPGVERFEIWRALKGETEHPYSITMEFENAAAFDRYNGHEIHKQFVEERWLPEVARFVELDYEKLPMQGEAVS